MKTLILFGLFFLTGPIFGQFSEEAASNATRQVNALMSDYTDTLITPTIHSDGVIVVSMKALQSEKIAKLWTFIAASAVGKYFNDHPDLSMKEIWFSDVTDLKAKPMRYAVLQVNVAKRVQAQVYAGTMELEDAQTKLWSSLVRKTKALN